VVEVCGACGVRLGGVLETKFSKGFWMTSLGRGGISVDIAVLLLPLLVGLGEVLRDGDKIL